MSGLNVPKKIEKKHGELRKRRMADLSTEDRIWHWYFNLDFDIVLTDKEEEIRRILDYAYKLVLKHYPAYQIHRIAALLCKKLETEKDFGIKRSERQCITYVQNSIKLFGQPIEIEKEHRRQIYIARLLNLAQSAEKEKEFNAAIKAVEKAADLEQFNQDNDELIRDLMKKQEAKEVVFASTSQQLEELIQERRKRYLAEEAEEAELVDDGE